MSSTAERALALLSEGVPANQVASALGVTESAISQYISDEQFAAKLAELRFEKLRKHNARDSELDELEDQLIKQLKTFAQLAVRPMEIARILQIVNSAKRRGASAPDHIHQATPVIRLSMPTMIVNQIALKVDVNNQVISANSHSLVTIPSGQISKLAEVQDAAPKNKQLTAADFGFA